MQTGERKEFENWWPSVGQVIGEVAAWEAWQARARLAGQVQQEPVAHTYAGFSGVFYQQNGHLPEAQEIWNAATRAALDQPDHAEALPDAGYIANALMKADENGYAAMSYGAMAETVLEALAAYRTSSPSLKRRT